MRVSLLAPAIQEVTPLDSVLYLSNISSYLFSKQARQSFDRTPSLDGIETSESNRSPKCLIENFFPD
jgi:hypothetical protein